MGVRSRVKKGAVVLPEIPIRNQVIRRSSGGGLPTGAPEPGSAGMGGVENAADHGDCLTPRRFNGP